MTAYTGFNQLDQYTNGLHIGLYVLAATSSLGKTTLALQTAENIAEQGIDVLYFTIEQGKKDVAYKSIARELFLAGAHDQPTAEQISQGKLDPKKIKTIFEDKSETYKHLSVIECSFNYTAEQIKQYILTYIKRNGTKPIVFIDYLQLLQPENQHEQVREGIDHAITKLKQTSRDNGLTIIVISSVNRTNYTSPISFESLKESGGIEYTADVVLGLQYAVTDELTASDKNKSKNMQILQQAKNEQPRKITMKCLKNRYGRDFTIMYNYYSAHDCYIELDEETERAHTMHIEEDEEEDEDEIKI